MVVVSGQTKRFTAADPVTRYWLAHCEGFSLAGGGCGTVERVLADDDPHVAAQLEIRRGHRRRRVPVSAVLEVLPAEHVLVVRGSERASRRREALGRAVALLGYAAIVLASLLLALAAWLVRTGKEGVRLVASLPWQQYGRSVRSVTTKLWQDLSTRLSLLRTTSSARISAWRSARRARTTSST